ncbi:NAD-dependent succinate-semialdehyde dehydrogenase [Georgenia yuyongxinii]|uniref:NAD-dependent succinate-semialdehyde dehydrogenase n=1 Tax=Georgenia yuyongxinii TaxID=2589797 RepID=A0A552WV67_9MICO|nr:NAD-dependent succinate-semialdehyde dehydrogenase [Georgenia yuyongxinii]TRW46738.1 NAD-dependent succinate-semialdehyde dehydrogenase [Georgenia yuyongxinii]
MTDQLTARRQDELLRTMHTDLYIDGAWREATGGRRFAVENPATGEELTTVADADPADAMAALDAADRAQAGWARTAPRERGEILRRAFELITARADDFALLMTLEMGKPLAESKGEATYGAEFFRWFSEEAVRIAGRYSAATDNKSRVLVTKRPVGPSILITPWNFPLAMGTRKIGPALAAGCTVVLKPAQLTPLTALLLAQVLEEAGVPAGVVNLVPTTRAGDTTGPLLQDPRARKLSFTGSTGVGRALLADASGQVLRTSMELGGNAPFLVFEDADVDAAVAGAMAAKFRNGGEACTAANRFLVHEAVAEEFTAKLVEKVRAVRLGPGTDDGVTLGPLVEEKARDKVQAFVADAVAHGAAVLLGGEVPEGPGWFYPATVLTGAGPQARLHREEIFGPVVSITTFADEAEAVRLANDTEFGLISFAFTTDLARGLRMAEVLETGMLGLNSGVISNPAAPFGGVKQSGIGREGAHEGIEEYLETVYVGIADPLA